MMNHNKWLLAIYLNYDIELFKTRFIGKQISCLVRVKLVFKRFHTIKHDLLISLSSKDSTKLDICFSIRVVMDSRHGYRYGIIFLVKNQNIYILLIYSRLP